MIRAVTKEFVLPLTYKQPVVLAPESIPALGKIMSHAAALLNSLGNTLYDETFALTQSYLKSSILRNKTVYFRPGHFIKLCMTVNSY